MDEYQMELLTLNKFITNESIYEKGIVQFLASGHYSSFEFAARNVPIQMGTVRQDLGVDRFLSKTPQRLIGDSQFNKLTFAPPPENMAQVQKEISEDIDGFLECMSNSVFYWSGVQRLYGAELDALRDKFLDLQTSRHRWSYYVEKYARRKSGESNSVVIPLPDNLNRYKTRQLLVKTMRAIKQTIYEIEN